MNETHRVAEFDVNGRGGIGLDVSIFGLNWANGVDDCTIKILQFTMSVLIFLYLTNKCVKRSSQYRYF